MSDFFFLLLSIVSVAAALLTAGFAVAKRLPNLAGLCALAAIELALLALLVASIVASLSGSVDPRANLAEYFVYLAVALLVPVLAAFWALIERIYWSNYVLAVGAFTVFVMVARMHLLWPTN